MHPCLIGFTLVARLAPHPSTMEVADRRTCPIDCAKKKKETNTRAIFCSIYIFLNLGPHSVPCFMDRWHHWHSLPWGPALSHAVALTRAHVKRLTMWGRWPRTAWCPCFCLQDDVFLLWF